MNLMVSKYHNSIRDMGTVMLHDMQIEFTCNVVSYYINFNTVKA